MPYRTSIDEDLENRQVIDATQALTGRVAGVSYIFNLRCSGSLHKCDRQRIVVHNTKYTTTLYY